MADIPHDPPGYFDRGEFAYKVRDLDEYKRMIFKEESNDWLDKRPSFMDSLEISELIKRHFYTIAHYYPKNDTAERDPKKQYQWDWPEKKIFGGFDGFFSPNIRILDAGAGYGQVVSEINQKYGIQNILAIGVDYRYHRDRPIKPNTHLAGGDFKNLTFKSDSFDRILTVESFPAFMPHDRKHIEKYFQEFTRVSKNGALWRGTWPQYDEDEHPPISPQELINHFCSNGWELVVFRSDAFVAKLQKTRNYSKAIITDKVLN